jgi:hypothetical protein
MYMKIQISKALKSHMTEKQNNYWDVCQNAFNKTYYSYMFYDLTNARTCKEHAT